jgi:hypothetical protein
MSSHRASDDVHRPPWLGDDRHAARRFPRLATHGLTVFCLATVFGCTLWTFVLPFLRDNQLVNWDIPGVYASAWYQRNFLFPRIIGWNPFVFLGYPQHQFYPPFFSYAAALLSFVVPLPWAFKLLVVATVIGLPASFYYCARSFGQSPPRAAVSMLLMFSGLFLYSNTFHGGGNWVSTFTYGLLTHALGMALFFAYAGVLARRCPTGSAVWPSALLAVIVLTHVIAALSASILVAACFVAKRREPGTLGWLAGHGGMAMLLTAFWTIPFFMKREWLSAGYLMPLDLLSVLPLLAGVVALWCWRGDRGAATLVWFLVLLSVFILAVQQWGSLPLQPYRFRMYLVLVGLLLIGGALPHRLWPLWLTAGLCVAAVSRLPVPDGAGARVPVVSDIRSVHFPIDGRLFVVGSYGVRGAPHALKQMLPVRTGSETLEGFYFESAINSFFIYGLEQEIGGGDLVLWKDYLEGLPPVAEPALAARILPRQLRLFNVEYLLARDGWGEDFAPIETVTLEGDGRTGSVRRYQLYRIGEPNLLEIVSVPVRPVTADWGEEAWRWFFSERVTTEMLVNEPVPASHVTGHERVVVEAASPTKESVRFRVDGAAEPVPVLIKMSAFPNWRAYENGRPLKLYLAAPYLMLVFAQGQVELTYESLWYDLAADGLSLAGVACLVVAGVRGLARRR